GARRDEPAEAPPGVVARRLAGRVAARADPLDGEPGFATPDEVRRAYAETLLTRAEGLLGRLTLPSGLAPAGPPYGWRLPATGEEPRP
ncbi:hypothetical protein ADL35_46040, partial [Streptomyces sp. NRRL WC-3753]